MSAHRTVALASLIAFSSLALAQNAATQSRSAPIALSGIHKIYIEKMPGDLDQYIRVEFMKQAKGKLGVVLDKSEADAILTGISEQKEGVAHTITGRYLGLEDNATAAISLVDPSGTQLLWAAEAGDRSLFFSVAHRNGERKVADRIVSQLLKAVGH